MESYFGMTRFVLDRLANGTLECGNTAPGSPLTPPAERSLWNKRGALSKVAALAALTGVNAAAALKLQPIWRRALIRL